METGQIILSVDSATDLARSLGVSDKFIAITILAGGTSFPELAACIVAASKHKNQPAPGNILGSNVFNILLFWAYIGRKCRIDRWEGAVMLLAGAGLFFVNKGLGNYTYEPVTGTVELKGDKADKLISML